MDIDSIDTLPDIPKPHAAHYQFRSGPRRKWQSRRHEIRARAKDFANSSDHATCADYGLECYSRVRGRGTSLATQHPSARYHHFYEDLKYTSRFNPCILDTAETGLKFERRSESRTKSYPRCASNDLDEAVDLAHSGIPLPGDGHHQRRPSLEREDAFYDGTTARGNVKVRTQARPTDDAEIAELYQMGLLYNSGEVDRGTFDINSIRHDEPTYIIRPSKRARKNAKAKGYTLEQPLHLDLSFSDIGDDEAIVRYLMALTDPGDSPDGAVGEEAQQSSPPLRVIYELAGSQGSVDIDASQPPDLILDSLSEYDTLPDSEVQPPSQREETMPDADPTDAWVILGDDS